ncbi:MAG: HD domain-containing protein, partial [Oscillibacter sp.]|nr:HD domain-containing protein [Oscillibacter sp.]
AGELIKNGIYPDVLNEKYVKMLYDSAPLHDIGKVKIPDAILNKPGKLTDDEFALMKTHTTEGANILRASLSEIEDNAWLSMAIDMAESHHERWDGNGYPNGLSGENIPLSARIMAVSDVFDALVSKRSYKEAFPIEDAMAIIRDCAGSQFDPKIVAVFVNAEAEVRKIANL